MRLVTVQILSVQYQEILLLTLVKPPIYWASWDEWRCPTHKTNVYQAGAKQEEVNESEWHYLLENSTDNEEAAALRGPDGKGVEERKYQLHHRSVLKLITCV